MENLSRETVKEMLLYLSDSLIEKEEELCQIDRNIGDGDHGIGISNGFKEVKKVISDDSLNVKEIFEKSGLALMESMGGASGMIFSALFLGISEETEENQLNLEHFSKGISLAVDNIKEIGKADLGDKTMLDSLIPASDELNNYNKNSTFVDELERATHTALEGVESTKNYIAKFGRAKFLGERSIGFQDAGATTVYYIFKFMFDFLNKNN